jgi:hypothetical protein
MRVALLELRGDVDSADSPNRQHVAHCIDVTVEVGQSAFRCWLTGAFVPASLWVVGAIRVTPGRCSATEDE